MFNGVVNKMWTKEVKTKYGVKPVNLFSLDGDTDTTFNLGFGKTTVDVGDRVSFSASLKYGEQQVDDTTLKIEERGVKVDTPASTPVPKKTGGAGSARGGYSRGNFPLDFTDGQRSILRQHAFTQASLLYRELGADMADADDSDGVEVIDEIIKLAYQIERYTSGDDLRKELQDDED